MKITKVEAFQVCVPTLGEYRAARGTHVALRTLVVRIRTDAGVTGVGEAHQGVAGYSEETLGTMHAAIHAAYGPAVIGCDLEEIERVSARLAQARRGNLFARCAIEMALFDALARWRGQSVAALLGGPVRRRLALAGIIGIDRPEAMAAKAATLVAAGYRTVKLKVGTGNTAEDLARVREVRRAVGPDVAIRLDANAGYLAADAVGFMRGLADLAVEYVEQPVPAEHLETMAKLCRLEIVPILSDEAVRTPADAYRVIKAGAVDAIKIKLSKVGGYLAARKIADITEAAGIRCIIGQGMCSSIEAAAEAQLACAHPHIHPVAEMVGPTKLRDDLARPGLDLQNGFLDLPEGDGIGVNLSAAALKRYAIAPASQRATAR